METGQAIMMQDDPFVEYFATMGSEQDTLHTTHFNAAVRKTAISKAYLRPEMVVADVGDGNGFIAIGLAPLVACVHVINCIPHVSDATPRHLAHFNNIVFHHMDKDRLPLADCSVDAVFASMCLRCQSDSQTFPKVLQEMVRILRPGGRVMIVDWGTHPCTGLRQEMAEEGAGPSREQLRAWLRAADLVNVLVRRIDQYTSLNATPDSCGDHSRAAHTSVWLATGSKRITMRQAVQEHYNQVALNHCGCGNVAEPASGCCTQTSSSVSCCGVGGTLFEEGSVEFRTDYSLDDLAALPPESEMIALGCGNPVALAGLHPGEIVLDIGSGGGIDAFMAARQVGPGGRVIGIDATQAMTERAARTAVELGIDNVEFRRGQAETLPVADASVDVVLSNCVVNLCEDKGVVFSEAFRVLKPGGRLEISDMVAAGPLPMALRLDEAAWQSCVSGALPEREYLDLVAEAGFEEITAQRGSSAGTVGNVPIYSIIVSARKPVTECQ